MIPLLFVGFDREVFVCQIKKDAFVYVGVNGGFAFDLCVELEPLHLYFSQNGFRAVFFVSDLVLDILGQFAIFADFELRPFCTQVLPVFFVGYVWTVSYFLCPVTIAVRILSAFLFTVHGRDMNAEDLRDFLW